MVILNMLNHYYLFIMYLSLKLKIIYFNLLTNNKLNFLLIV